MSELLQQLTHSCFTDRDVMVVARAQAALWERWLLPVTDASPVRAGKCSLAGRNERF